MSFINTISSESSNISGQPLQALPFVLYKQKGHMYLYTSTITGNKMKTSALTAMQGNNSIIIGSITKLLRDFNKITQLS